MEIVEELGDKGEIGRKYKNMGNAYSNTGQYDKAIDCYRKALEIAKELGDKREVKIICNNMGAVQTRDGICKCLTFNFFKLEKKMTVPLT